MNLCLTAQLLRSLMFGPALHVLPLLLLLGCCSFLPPVVAAGSAKSPAVDCTAVCTAAYRAIFDRDPDPVGLQTKVSACQARTPWPAGSFNGKGDKLVGKPWSPAGMVHEFRTSPEYAEKGLTPSLEKGGCSKCTAIDKADAPGQDCSVLRAPPDDPSIVACVLVRHHPIPPHPPHHATPTGPIISQQAPMFKY